MPPALIVLASDVGAGVPGVADGADRADGLLDATLDLARRVGGVGRVLLFHPPEVENRLAARALGFRLWPADGDTAGERYANAFRHAGELDYDGALVIGLDVPDLDPERLSSAAELLGQHQGIIAENGRGGIAVLGLQHDEPHLFPRDAGPPSAEVIRTRARQQLVRLHDIGDHEALTPDRVDEYLAARGA